MPYVQTVLGRVVPNALGAVIGHEHIFSLVPGPWLSGGTTDQTVDIAVNALSTLRDLSVDGTNVQTICDISPYGVVGRDEYGDNVALLKEVSEQTNLCIVSGSGTYLDAYSPQWIQEINYDDMVQRFIDDATIGIGDSGVKAGIFGEQATGLGEISVGEELRLRACGQASIVTGLAIKTHTTHGTMALEQIQILQNEGLTDLSRVVIGHQDTQEVQDLNYVRSVLATGAHVGIDTVGKQEWDFFLSPPLPPEERPDGVFTKNSMWRSDEKRADMIATLVSEGHAGQIHLSMDLTGAEVYMNPTTHGQQGYNYLVEIFVPLLLSKGITTAQVTQMLVTNEQEILTLQD